MSLVEVVILLNMSAEVFFHLTCKKLRRLEIIFVTSYWSIINLCNFLIVEFLDNDFLFLLHLKLLITLLGQIILFFIFELDWHEAVEIIFNHLFKVSKSLSLLEHSEGGIVTFISTFV